MRMKFSILSLCAALRPEFASAECSEGMIVPSLAGVPAVEAYIELQGAGFDFQVTSVEDSKCLSQPPIKYVRSTTPVAGTCIDADTPPLVILTIQRGKRPVVVPKIIGLTEKQAEHTLGLEGLQLAYSREDANVGSFLCVITVSKGFGPTITKQYPAFGQEVCRETTVTGVNRERVGYVNVPNCIVE